MQTTDLMEVALELIDEELKESKKAEKDQEAKKTEEAQKTEEAHGRYRDWKSMESGVSSGHLSYACEFVDYPNIDLRRVALVKELDMMNMSGLLSKEDAEELRTMRQEVDSEFSVMDDYMKRNFYEKKSHNPRH